MAGSPWGGVGVSVSSGTPFGGTIQDLTPLPLQAAAAHWGRRWRRERGAAADRGRPEGERWQRRDENAVSFSYPFSYPSRILILDTVVNLGLV
jgi:hypothetical protein